MYARVRENSIGACISVALLTKAAEGFAQKGAGISHGLVRVLHEARCSLSYVECSAGAESTLERD